MGDEDEDEDEEEEDTAWGRNQDGDTAMWVRSKTKRPRNGIHPCLSRGAWYWRYLL